MSSRRIAGVALSDSSGDSAESDDSDMLFEFDDDPHPGATSTASASVRRDFVLVGVLTSFAAAQREMSERDDYVHTYETRYETDRLLVHVFLCRSHEGCAHRYKIRRIAVGDTDPEVEFHLEEHGDHALTALPVRRRGIHPTLTEEVDALLDMGWGAMQLRNLLNHKYRDDPRRLRIVPTCKQLENRKAFLVRSSPNGWEVKNHATFTAWASTRICSTRDEFDSISDPADRKMDDMIVLDAFSFGSVDTESGTSFGVLVTSRRVFRNIVTCARDQGQQLVCSTDGTYKLHFGGWTVVDCGSNAVFWDRNSYVHRFVPWLYMFVRSESTEAYRRMFSVTKARASLFFGLEVEVAFGSLDHCDAIASAFLSVWPSITLLTCWPHLARQARKKKSLLVCEANYDELIKPNLQWLRQARTHAQFLKMGDILMEYWASYGERVYADWFRSVYLHVRWDRWHVTGAGVGGILPSQQGIEAHHSVIKKTCAPSPRASTNGVLKGILPRILKLDGERLCPTSATHFCVGPVPPEMLAKAQRLSASTRNYCKLKKGRGSGRRLVAIIFNAAKFTVGGAGILGVEVDQQRAEKFVRSLEGKFPRGLKALEIEFELLSLHRVTIGTVEPEGQLQLDPVWSMTNIQIVRSYVQCGCESYVRTGWVCSHALAALSLQGFLDLNAAMASVPVRRAPGRPPNRRPALARESREEGYFNVDRLVRLFLQKPGQPLKWKVIADMDVEVEGDIESSMFIGQVVGLRLSDGVYIWSVRFADGDLCDYEAEQLARAVNRAHELGVNVTSE